MPNIFKLCRAEECQWGQGGEPPTPGSREESRGWAEGQEHGPQVQRRHPREVLWGRLDLPLVGGRPVGRGGGGGRGVGGRRESEKVEKGF